MMSEYNNGNYSVTKSGHKQSCQMTKLAITLDYPKEQDLLHKT